MRPGAGDLELDWEVCDLLRVIGAPSRFRILQYLTDDSRNVSEIVRALGMRQSLVSHHLRVLRDRGLLDATRDGPFVRYSVSRPEIERIFLLAGEIASKNTPVSGGER